MKIDFRSFGMGMAVGAGGMFAICVAIVLIMASVIRARDKSISALQVNSPVGFCPVAGDEAVTQELKPIRQKFNVPGMAAAVVTSEGIKLVGAVGVRKRGTETPVTLSDLWHLGSDGKAMTSTLIARLVERGMLKWNSTIAEVFPELAPQLDPDFGRSLCSTCYRIGQVCR
jgi:CubicO group peptidase (beta-lactamase class C family)